MNGKSDDLVVSESVETEVVEINKRVQNVEKLMETVKEIGNQAIELGKDYIKETHESNRVQMKHEDAQHQRAVRVLVFFVAVLFTFSTIALLSNKIDIVKIVLQSSLGVAAGTGIAGLYGSRKSNGDS